MRSTLPIATFGCLFLLAAGPPAAAAGEGCLQIGFDPFPEGTQFRLPEELAGGWIVPADPPGGMCLEADEKRPGVRFSWYYEEGRRWALDRVDALFRVKGRMDTLPSFMNLAIECRGLLSLAPGSAGLSVSSYPTSAIIEAMEAEGLPYTRGRDGDARIDPGRIADLLGRRTLEPISIVTYVREPSAGLPPVPCGEEEDE